ncbi:MAG: hypothetical protein K2M47_06260 [Clostridiales bacterium]|nr:hypothetical protein [Clostridiales bacterium]
MKKSTKLLIAATVVASVVSVGSVSYALWSAGSNQKQEISGTTGAINTVGELTVEIADSSKDSEGKLKALYPVDQGSGTRYWEFDVTVTGEGEQVVTVKGELTKTVAETGTAALYYSTTAPTGAAVDGAKLISGTGIDPQEITMDEEGKATVYIYMTANGTDAMKASIKLTFEASAAAD